jgi:hypothetical protein
MDGTPNCEDSCPGDTKKTAPGVCGCGVLDIDADNDGDLASDAHNLRDKIGSSINLTLKFSSMTQFDRESWGFLA